MGYCRATVSNGLADDVGLRYVCKLWRWVREGFLQLAVALRRVVYLLTTDDILGRAGLKDVTKGCSVSLGGFLFVLLKGCVTWN